MLELALMECELTALEKISLPDYKGSSLRGMLAYALKKTVCNHTGKDCLSCSLSITCPYLYMFETKNFFLNLSSYERGIIPPPLIIVPPQEKKNHFSVGETLSFNLVLFASANQYSPLLFNALNYAGKTGLGSNRGRFELTGLRDIINRINLLNSNEGLSFCSSETGFFSWEDATNVAESLSSLDDVNITGSDLLTIKFHTPARFKYQKKFVKNISFEILYSTIIHRLRSLSVLYGNKIETPGEKEKMLIEKAAAIKTIESNTFWHDWSRYSNRSHEFMKLGGLLGDVTFKGDFSPFLPGLLYCQKSHLGNSTSFGLGRYEIILKPPR